MNFWKSFPVVTRTSRTGPSSTAINTEPWMALLLELSSWIGLILHSIGWQGEFGLNAVSTFYWFYCYGDSLAQIWEICMRDKNFQYVMIQLTKKTLLISAMAIPTSSSSFSEKWCGEIRVMVILQVKPNIALIKLICIHCVNIDILFYATFVLLVRVVSYV